MDKRIILISDSHGSSYNILQVINMHRTAYALIHLGDGISDLEQLDNNSIKIIIKIKGNCDYFSNSPDYLIEEINNRRLYITHGYKENVKYSDIQLSEKATRTNSDLVVFGHTHKQKAEYINGIWYVNPGSIRYGEYALIDITDNGQIMPILNKLY